jgi:hypothetical protein
MLDFQLATPFPESFRLYDRNWFQTQTLDRI